MLGQHLAGDLLGEPSLAQFQPLEAFDDRVGEPGGQPAAELVPDLQRIRRLEDLADLVHHRPAAFPEVEFDVGEQLGNAVVERLLPAAGDAPEILGAALRGFQLHQGLGGGSWVLRRQFGTQRVVDLGERFGDVVRHQPAGQVLVLAGHLGLEEFEQWWEAGFDVEVGVLGLHRVHPDARRNREDLGGDTGVVEVLAVDLQDLAPVRGPVDLRQHQRDVRAQRGGLLEEGQLVGGELLGGVGDHQQRVGLGDHAERGRGQRRGHAADARGVHQRETVLQHDARDADLAAGDRAAVREGAVELFADLLDGHRQALQRRRPVRRFVLDEQGGRLVGVPDEGRHDGGDIVAGGTHRGVHDGVDQGAFALLRFAHDQHEPRWVEHAGADLPQPPVQIGALLLGTFRSRAIDQFHQRRLDHGVDCGVRRR